VSPPFPMEVVKLTSGLKVMILYSLGLMVAELKGTGSEVRLTTWKPCRGDSVFSKALDGDCEIQQFRTAP
jgi:hypothetical protein